jgi:hypothetical protein
MQPRVQGQGLGRVLARVGVVCLHGSLPAARCEAQPVSRRRRRKSANTGPHTKHGPFGDLLAVRAPRRIGGGLSTPTCVLFFFGGSRNIPIRKKTDQHNLSPSHPVRRACV